MEVSEIQVNIRDLRGTAGPATGWEQHWQEMSDNRDKKKKARYARIGSVGIIDGRKQDKMKKAQKHMRRTKMQSGVIFYPIAEIKRIREAKLKSN